MSRCYINELRDAESVDEIFRATGKQLRANRNGNHYLQLQLSDRSGSVTAMMWNANEKIYRSFENGDFVRVEGAAQLYNGSVQVIANRVEMVPAKDIDESEFMPLSGSEVDGLVVRLQEILRGARNIHLRNLAECFLMDEPFMDRFTRAPAGIKIHHAYRGGLLQHVVGLMEVCQLVAPRYPQVDLDLLTIGAFLHDVGKIDELEYDRDMSYTDEGQMIGHLVIGVKLLEEKAKQAEELSGEPFPEELAIRIKHMIVSHHGEYEFGSPKLPMTLEAVALHYLDSLDSKIHSFQQLIDEDPNSESRWTTYHPNIGRKLYKGESSG